MWQLPQIHKLHQLLERDGWNKQDVFSLSNEGLTLAAVAHYKATLPMIDRANISPLSKALLALRESRDKVIAHNEAIDRASRQKITWSETELLVKYAKEFVITISFAYLNVYMGNSSDDYLVSFDAHQSSRSLRQLLQAANITAKLE